MKTNRRFAQKTRLLVTLAVLLGLDELGADRVRLRTMDGGGEEDLAAAGLAAGLAARLGKES